MDPSLKVDLENDTYRMVSVISPDRIVLGRSSYFEEEQYIKSYERLEKDLNMIKWANLPTPVEPERFKVGEFVLAKSEEVGGTKRGVVQETTSSSSGDVVHKVFLYDHGRTEEIVGESLTVMDSDWKYRLPPRTKIIILRGLVPAKVLLQSEQSETDHKSAMIMQDCLWSKKALREVKQWFANENSRVLYVVNYKENNDYSCIGDIVRRPVKTSGCEEEKPESLVKWKEDNKIALFNEQLYLSQMTLYAPAEPPVAAKPERKHQQQSSQTLANSLTLTNGVCSVYGPQQAGTVNGEDVWDELQFDAPAPTEDFSGSVLVRGGKSRPPLKSIQQLGLPKGIVDVLCRMGIKDLTDVQRTVASNFTRHSDLLLISPDDGVQQGRNGRLLSYALTIVKLVHERYEGESFKKGDLCSPEAIIVVNSFSVGEGFKTFLQQILSYSQRLPLRVEFLSREISFEEYSKSPEKYTKKILPPGISILIVTLSNFSDMLRTFGGTRLFEQLRFLVFEETECYVQAQTELLASTIATLRHNAVTNPDVSAFQLAFSGSLWFPAMEELYSSLVKYRSPIVVIGALNQVIRYANIGWNVHHVKTGEDEMELKAKSGKLLELLSREFVNGHRIVIACRSTIVANEIYGYIGNEVGFKTVVASNHSTQEDLTSAKNRWDRGDENIAIIPDEMIHRFEVTDATCVIQYDCPLKERCSEGTSDGRYSFVWSNIRDIDEGLNPLKVVGRDSSDSRYPRKLVTHILMTEEDPKYLHELYDFSKSLDTNITFPRKLVELAETIALSGETGRSLCTGIKLYGFCNKAHHTLCSELHEFTRSEISAEPVAPVDGQIEVRIVQCVNPSLFKVQLLRHFVYVDGRKKCNKSYLEELCKRNQAMNEYYCPLLNDPEMSAANLDYDETASDCPRLQTSKIAGKCQRQEEMWCAVYDPSSRSYVRARVLTIVKHDVMGLPEAVRVQVIDTGSCLNPTLESLYELPSKFKNWPPLIVNLVLGNLKPIRGEMEYRALHIDKAKDVTKGQIFEAKIWLSIGDTIWVNPMVEYVVDSETKKLVKGQSVRMEFMQRRIAEINGDHLGILMTKVANHGDLYRGISVVKAELLRASNKKDGVKFRDDFEAAKEEFHQIGDPIWWAFVEKSSSYKMDPAKILAIYGRTPWMFFGAHEKFQDQLKDLEEDLHNYVEDYKSEKSGRKWTTCTEILAEFLQPEMIVAVKEREENSWMRAKIISKTEKNCGGSSKTVFKVFFVDYGDEGVDMEVEEIFPIPHRFVTKLPFQAIAFKLDCIKPKDCSGGWSKAAVNYFLDTIMPNSKSAEIEILAFGNAEQEDSMSVSIPCQYYSCVGFIDEDELSTLLVHKNLACWKPDGEVVVSTAQRKLLEHYTASVNSVLAWNEEDPDDEGVGSDFEGVADAISAMQLAGDFDVRVNNVNGLLSSLVPTRNGFIQPALNLNSIEYGAEGGDRFENVAAANAMILPSNSNSPLLMDRSQDFGPPDHKTSVGERKEQPTSSTTPLYLYPMVLWRQTENSLVLTVQLPNVKEYDLRVEEDKRTIFFRTKDMPKNYNFVLNCFGKVSPDFKVHLTGQYLRATFRKMLAGVKWTRLLYEEGVKYHWLKPELDLKDQGDDEVIFNDAPKRGPINVDQVTVQLEKDGEMIDNDGYDEEDDDPEENDLGIDVEPEDLWEGLDGDSD